MHLRPSFSYIASSMPSPHCIVLYTPSQSTHPALVQFLCSLHVAVAVPGPYHILPVIGSSWSVSWLLANGFRQVGVLTWCELFQWRKLAQSYSPARI